MKKYVGSFLMLLLTVEVFAVSNDTIRLYNPATVTNTTINPASYPIQAGRFDLASPAWIKGFIITVKDTGSVTLTFCGHEGGVALATLFNPLLPPITVRNNQMDVQKIFIELQDSILLSNDQFFLQFSNFKGKLRLVTDRTDHPISCTSASGGDYRYMYGKGPDGNLYLLTSTNRAFAIDVIAEYVNKNPDNYFTDITAQAGISTSLSNSSIAAGDYNGDNYPDLLISGRLHRNNLDGTFTDVTSSLGVTNKYSGVSANAFADMDNDGDQDIILFGGDTSVLFENTGGIFTEHILHLKNFKSFLCFSLADINFDGYPDLFVGQLWSTYPQPEPNYFFLNDKNLDFTDNTTMIYPDYDGNWNWPGRAWDPANYIVERNRNSRGSQWVDFDNDGDQDLFVTNYFLQPDEFYRNNGNGTFTDICQAKNIDKNNAGSNHGTGVDWYDYNNDEHMDLLLPQFAHPHFISQGLDHRGTAIYSNQGPPSYNFTDVVGQYNQFPGLKSNAGLELEETHAGGAWGDIDNDGLADFLMTVFYGCRYIELYRQKADHSFEIVTYNWGLNRINTGTDLVWLDFDCNGKLDLACGVDGQFRLFRNNFPNRNFIEINLRGTTTNKFAIGARCTVYAGGKKYTQEVTAGRGEKMQKPYTLLFGLDWTSVIDSVVVLWPSNPQKKDVYTGLLTEKVYLLTEGGSHAVSISGEQEKNPLMMVYPNPVKDKLEIQVTAGENAHFTIEIYNQLMQRVAIITDRQHNSGNCHFTWDVREKAIPAGIYFCKLSSEGKEQLQRFVVIRD